MEKWTACEVMVGNRGHYKVWPTVAGRWLASVALKKKPVTEGMLLGVENTKEEAIAICERYDHPDHGRQV